MNEVSKLDTIRHLTSVVEFMKVLDAEELKPVLLAMDIIYNIASSQLTKEEQAIAAKYREDVKTFTSQLGIK